MKLSASVQFLRYALVGVLSNASGYLIYLLVTWLGVGPKLTMTLLYGVGATVGYFGNRHWTFSYRGDVWTSVAKYMAVHLCGYAINFFMLFYFVDKLGYPHQWVQAVAVVVVAAFLFTMFRGFVFRQHPGEHGDAA